MQYDTVWCDAVYYPTAKFISSAALLQREQQEVKNKKLQSWMLRKYKRKRGWNMLTNKQTNMHAVQEPWQAVINLHWGCECLLDKDESWSALVSLLTSDNCVSHSYCRPVCDYLSHLHAVCLWYHVAWINRSSHYCHKVLSSMCMSIISTELFDILHAESLKQTSWHESQHQYLMTIMSCPPFFFLGVWHSLAW